MIEPSAAQPHAPGASDANWVASVPNFAEGRDRLVVHAILAAMQLPGVLLLDYLLDAGRNRSVITIAGPSTAVWEAVVRAAGVATDRIDLTRQVGSHPRIGATDVIPFVPVGAVALLPCVLLAREAAAALWQRYHVPAYLYEAAASRPDRVLLEDVRRGQFEGLREAVLRDPGRRPDVGGPGLHPSAGATAVGARRALIEYNIALDTADLAPARAIAKAVRGQSSGLGVRALALLSEGRAQVTLGIPDHRQSSVGVVHAAVEEAARKHRTSILFGEIIGLLPEAAYEESSAWVAGLRGFRAEEHILERRLKNPLAWPATLLERDAPLPPETRHP
ncbi:glutamate formimidoyltransferase [Acidipila sp. EB88]|uniref:glutamate formimidoyltransferase n=1 Tax=Acidipila sp. EB88 TaxID=2305226 RepID=UPI000F5F96E0|nr:glutamate formimidoyltransferase [Acidipila sp. EB88]RRA49486.1 glutamate formimidoyltransferase [Acidipila sp. EB88]